MATYLIVANQTTTSPTLAEALRERMAKGASSFHVVVPATPLPHRLTWDEQESNAAAAARLETLLEWLRQMGAVEADGEIGVSDPVDAVADAVRGRTVDEVIVSTLPPGISRWLKLDVANRISGMVNMPVTVVYAPKEATAQA
jgi:hypothetical protein